MKVLRVPALVAAVAALGLASTALLAHPAAASVAASDGGGTARVVQSAKAAYVAKTAFRVRLVGLNRAHPVVISWGDGQTTRVTGRCSVRAAAHTRAACARLVSHVFQSPGDYTLVGTQAGARFWVQPVTVVPADAAATGQGWQQEMLTRVNALRADAGAPPLALCSPLTTAAQTYADVMEAKQHFDHVGLDGSLPWDRAKAAGYRGNAYGENIAWGQTDVASVVRDWRQSPGHYANMISGQFTHVGFGYATDGGKRYGASWVQDFGSGGSC